MAPVSVPDDGAIVDKIVAWFTCRKLGQALGMTIIADKISTHITTDGKADPER